MTRTSCAPGYRRRCAARTSRVKSYQSRYCQSASGYGIAFTCLYAASGKNTGRPKRGFPVVTASHRSAIALRKAAESVRGRVGVCGRAPAPGATGSEAGGEVAVACGVALPGGVAVLACGDPVAVTLAGPAGGWPRDWLGDWLGRRLGALAPHPPRGAPGTTRGARVGPPPPGAPPGPRPPAPLP